MAATTSAPPPASATGGLHRAIGRRMLLFFVLGDVLGRASTRS